MDIRNRSLPDPGSVESALVIVRAVSCTQQGSNSVSGSQRADECNLGEVGSENCNGIGQIDHKRVHEGESTFHHPSLASLP
eukprot:CAMPEP_0196726288 /NCGR_PEP_ID=MMETSP1091-20130531/7605_1 /TAXON_ID=302021 /ORGANISM="Rhodomonas sp., Strain CCMP768" /LENGTH=80 /DNA_ID=CAMNT_0042068701 /DNA_START=233 /DNA_END=471 /DNA_ORIENTATION=-